MDEDAALKTLGDATRASIEGIRTLRGHLNTLEHKQLIHAAREAQERSALAATDARLKAVQSAINDKKASLADLAARIKSAKVVTWEKNKRLDDAVSLHSVLARSLASSNVQRVAESLLADERMYSAQLASMQDLIADLHDNAAE